MVLSGSDVSCKKNISVLEFEKSTKDAKRQSVGQFVCLAVLLFAGIDLLWLGAGVALDEAAPVESAVAPLLHDLLLDRVPTTAAHDATAVRSLGRLVARSSMSTKCAHVTVVRAVVGRGVKEDKVLGRWNDRLATPDLKFAPLVQPDFCG